MLRFNIQRLDRPERTRYILIRSSFERHLKCIRSPSELPREEASFPSDRGNKVAEERGGDRGGTVARADLYAVGRLISARIGHRSGGNGRSAATAVVGNCHVASITLLMTERAIRPAGRSTRSMSNQLLAGSTCVRTRLPGFFK